MKLILLVAVIAAFVLCAGCTLQVPGGNATAAPTAVTGTLTTAPTGTPTAAATATVTRTATATATVTRTATTTATATRTVTATATRTPAGPGSISGAKWNDLNGDHRRGQYEPTLAGWTITLEMQEQNGPNWVEVGRTTTGANGVYSFTGLAEGHYRVYEAGQTGWTRTFPTDVDGMHNLVISNGQPSWTGQDFGNTAGAAATTATTTTTGTATATATVTPTATATGTTTATATPTTTGTAATTVTPVTSGTGGTITYFADILTARNLAFDKTSFTVPAGATVALTFVNDDAGVPHNFALYTDSSATTTIFKGGIVTGQMTTVYTFTAPSTPGTYFFRCDVHPTTMTGSFVVT